jgi:nucleoside-diphosphate-sugar epimerase
VSKETLNSRYWKDKKVLVTGGCGMMGSYVTELLINAGARVRVADNLSRGSTDFIKGVLNQVDLQKKDLLDLESCREVCKGQEIVMNLAAKVTGIEYNRTHQAEMFETNFLLQRNVIHAAAECGVKRFLQVSTACVYPHDSLVPTPESEGERGTPEPTNEGYGWAKRMGERLAVYYTRETPMECVIARPFNAYGPHDNFSEAESHVIPALITRVLESHNPVQIWGSGNQKRVFIHARDVALGMVLLTEKARPAEPVNIGHDQMVTIKELFATICRVLGRSPEPRYDTTKPEGYPARAADTRKLKSITGFVPATPLEEGIREMVDWVREKAA